jgi:hypothetical protein
MVGQLKQLVLTGAWKARAAIDPPEYLSSIDFAGLSATSAA